MRRRRWREPRKSLTTLHTVESHISNSICLRLPGRHRTIERKTIILPRTNEEQRERMKRGWNWRRKGEDCLALARGQDARNKFENEREGEGKWYERMGDSIVGVAPTTKYHRLFLAQPYADSGVQPSADNRTGYVVDLAGNIYELLLSSPLFLIAFLSFLLIFSFITSYCFLSLPSPFLFLFSLSLSYSNLFLMRT